MATDDSDSFSGVKESGIRKMTRLAVQHGAVNLSQGFPNEPPPSDGVTALICGLLGGTDEGKIGVENMSVQSVLKDLGQTESKESCDEKVTVKDFVTAIASRCKTDFNSQYSFPFGRPKLRSLIQKYYEFFYPGKKGTQVLPSTGRSPVDAETCITVTLGATEALAAVIRTIMQPGDAMLMMAPYHELYPAQSALFHVDP